MDHYIVSGITILVLGIIYKIASKSNSVEIADAEIDSYVFRPNKLYFYVGILCFFLAIVIFGIFPFMLDEVDFIQFALFMTPLAVLFGFCGWYFFQEYNFHRIIFLESGLKVTDWLKRDVIIDYQDLESARFNSILGKVILKSSKNQKVKILQFVVGQNTLLDLLEVKTDLDLTTVKKVVNRKFM